MLENIEGLMLLVHGITYYVCLYSCTTAIQADKMLMSAPYAVMSSIQSEYIYSPCSDFCSCLPYYLLISTL